MLRWTVLLVLAIAVAVGRPATAQDERPTLVESIAVEEMAAVLRQAGYRAVVSEDKDGFPQIESGAQGLSFWVYFYDCSEQPPKTCRSLSFITFLSAGEGVTLERVNEWNQSRRFGRAYLDRDGNATLMMDVDLVGGVTRANLKDWLLWWDDRVGKFAQHMG